MAETTTTSDPAAAVERLTAALAKERDDHKATRAALAELRDGLKEHLGLKPDAGLPAIVDALASRVENADSRVSEATAELSAELEAAKAEAATVKAERVQERIDCAITAALGRSNVLTENHEDAANMLRPLFHLDDAGSVVTRGEDSGEVAGMTPAQFIVSRLTALRGHWFAPSVSGGATGASGRGVALTGNVSCFKPGPTWNLTQQGVYEATYGRDAAAQARRMFGGKR